MRLRLVRLVLLGGLGAGLLPAAADAAACTGLPKHGNLPVVDAANVVPPDEEAWLAADLLRHHASGHEAIVAATVPDLGGDDVSSYAKRLFDCWRIGDAQSDNGLLILVAMREQKVRIEAGAGLADRLPEERLEAAIDEMVDPLRRGDVGAGLRAAAVSLVDDLGGRLPDSRAGNQDTPPMSEPGEFEDVPDVDALPFPYADDGAGPFAPVNDGGGARIGLLIPVLFMFAVVAAITSAVFRRSPMGSGGSAWRGGFLGGGMGGWASPAVLRGGAWHIGGQPAPPSRWASHWGGGHGGGPHGAGWSGGSGGGSSFGGGSSGGGGASGSFGSSGDSGSSGGSSFGGGSSGGGGASGSW